MLTLHDAIVGLIAALAQLLTVLVLRRTMALQAKALSSKADEIVTAVSGRPPASSANSGWCGNCNHLAADHVSALHPQGSTKRPCVHCSCEDFRPWSG